MTQPNQQRSIDQLLSKQEGLKMCECGLQLYAWEKINGTMQKVTPMGQIHQCPVAEQTAPGAEADAAAISTRTSQQMHAEPLGHPPVA